MLYAVGDDDVSRAVRDGHDAAVQAALGHLELPQREIGGRLPQLEALVAQVEWARGRGAATHLDGARIWEAAPYYERPHP